MGRIQKNHGDSFEKLIACRAEDIGLSLITKRIDRSLCQYSSLPDIEFIDHPEFKVDCKFTVGEFSQNEIKKMLAETEQKYGKIALLVVGQRKGRTRFNIKDALVYFYNIDGYVTCHYFDDFLIQLDKRKRSTFK